MTDANHPGAERQISWELVSSRFARCPILFKPLGAKESSNVELLVQFLIVTESCSSGKICFPRHQAQATQIGVETFGLMRTYGFFQLQYDLCATFFLSQLENVNAAEVNRRETLVVTESCSSGKSSEISSLQAIRIGVKTLKSASIAGLFQLCVKDKFVCTFLSFSA